MTNITRILRTGITLSAVEMTFWVSLRNGTMFLCASTNYHPTKHNCSSKVRSCIRPPSKLTTHYSKQKWITIQNVTQWFTITYIDKSITTPDVTVLMKSVNDTMKHQGAVQLPLQTDKTHHLAHAAIWGDLEIALSVDALLLATLRGLDATRRLRLVLTHRRDLSPAKEATEHVKRNEQERPKGNQHVRKAHAMEKTDLDRNHEMTSDPIVDALDHPTRINPKHGANLVHLRPDLFVWKPGQKQLCFL